MRRELPPIPTQQEFAAGCRAAFAFLGEHGFAEVPPPRHRRSNPFQVWFRAGERSVVVSGEGHGLFARIHLEHDSGVRAPEIDLVSIGDRPARNRRGRGTAAGQLAEIARAAERVRRFAVDFLEGDLERFHRLAKPLPSSLCPATSDG